MRDPDEWADHHLTSVASLETNGDGGVVRAGEGGGSGGGVGDVGAPGRTLAGLGGEGCRLAEVDGSAVAIVEVMRPGVVFLFCLWCFLPVLFVLVVCRAALPSRADTATHRKTFLKK